MTKYFYTGNLCCALYAILATIKQPEAATTNFWVAIGAATISNAVWEWCHGKS